MHFLDRKKEIQKGMTASLSFAHTAVKGLFDWRFIAKKKTVGGFHPFEKYARQIASCQLGLKICKKNL